MYRKISIIVFTLLALVIFGLTGSAMAAERFFIVKEFDALERTEVEAQLIKSTSQLYWYAEADWWQELSFEQKSEIESAIAQLSDEFEFRIYPSLTLQFGADRNLGAGDRRTTILIHRMVKDAEGYWSSKDEYDRLLVPLSNQRKMIYLAADEITEPFMKSVLAHEFMHAIIFNQKTAQHGVEQELWLNEAIAEMAPRYLGYDEMPHSNLDRRIQEFMSHPDDALLSWEEEPYDYASVNMFMQYFVDKYGWKVVTSAIKNQEVGIASLNSALEENGFKERFNQVFVNWVLALALNDCDISELYCYTFSPLKDFRVTPRLNFLPISKKGTLSVSLSTKAWAPNWHKFVGGNNDLVLEFSAPSKVNVQLPYIIEYARAPKSLRVVEVARGRTFKLEIPNFGQEVTALTIMPLILEGEKDVSHLLFWKVTVSKEGEEDSEALAASRAFLSPDKEELLRKIEELKALVEELKVKIAALGGVAVDQVSCSSLERNLFYGMRGFEVRCLQEFLKSQGPEIYPEGLVTGNFLELTKAAVIRFQEKYASEILEPLGLSRGTGFVGLLTRVKANAIMEAFKGGSL